MMREAAQPHTSAKTEETLSQAGDCVGGASTTAAVATESRVTATVTRTLR